MSHQFIPNVPDRFKPITYGVLQEPFVYPMPAGRFVTLRPDLPICVAGVFVLTPNKEHRIPASELAVGGLVIEGIEPGGIGTVVLNGTDD